MDDQETIDRLVYSCHKHQRFQEKSPSEEVYCALIPDAVGLKGEVKCQYKDMNCSWGVRDGIVLFGCGYDGTRRKDD